MLNRRVLRIKAMQALYALERSKASYFELAMDQIKAHFTPNLNADIIPDRSELKEKEKLAVRIFKNSFDKEKIISEEGADDEIRQSVVMAKNFYERKTADDYQLISKNMLAEAEEIKHLYFKILQLLVVFADCVIEDIEKRKNSKQADKKQIFESELNLTRNVFIQKIKENTELQHEIIRTNLTWSEDMIDVQQWYREVLKKDEEYIAYTNNTAPTFEDEYAIIDHIVKNVILKSELITQFFELQDLYWSENKSTIRSMIRKSLKSVGNAEEPLVITRLSADWEEDREFFKELFKLTYQGDVEYEQLVARFAKNWDVERIAAVDVILLKMALCEMINFMGIPVKVTINEYIDITKNYGTEKSKQFINGILDKAAETLSAEGVIRKSGRGLIDNK